jgi:hypothetical protein
MKIIYNKYLPPKGFKAINLFGVVFARRNYGSLDIIEVNHESIHTIQAREMLFVFFYVFYIVEWVFRLMQYRNFMMAYYNISFEREAYDNQNNMSYLADRKLYAFSKYLRKKS